MKEGSERKKKKHTPSKEERNKQHKDIFIVVNIHIHCLLRNYVIKYTLVLV